MLRDIFSYWLDVTGEDAGKAAKLLDEDGTLQGQLVSPTKAEYQVPDGTGAIEEWTDVDTVMLSISTACPKAVLSLLSINEDRGSERRSIYAGGSLVKDVYSRVVGADDGYDKITVNAIVARIRAAGNEELADMISKEFGGAQ